MPPEHPSSVPVALTSFRSLSPRLPLSLWTSPVCLMLSCDQHLSAQKRPLASLAEALLAVSSIGGRSIYSQQRWYAPRGKATLPATMHIKAHQCRHTRRTQSLPPEAAPLPDGLQSTQKTSSACPGRSSFSLREATSHTCQQSTGLHLPPPLHAAGAFDFAMRAK